MRRTLALAVLIASAPSMAEETALPAEASNPSKLPHLRLYLGGAAANEAQNGPGRAFVAGISGLSDVTPVVQWYWDAELWGVVVGGSQFPVISGDIGVRYTPFPAWPVRPFVRGGGGVSVLVILPVPSLTLGLGANVPLFDAFTLEGSIAVRRAFNVFNSAQTLDLGLFEIGLGF